MRTCLNYFLKRFESTSTSSYSGVLLQFLISEMDSLACHFFAFWLASPEPETCHLSWTPLVCSLFLKIANNLLSRHSFCLALHLNNNMTLEDEIIFGTILCFWLNVVEYTGSGDVLRLEWFGWNDRVHVLCDCILPLGVQSIPPVGQPGRPRVISGEPVKHHVMSYHCFG